MGSSRQFDERIETALPSDWRQVGLVIAVSGGADSVALLRAVGRLAPPCGRVAVAHFNHRLRGEESDADQQFVERLASTLGLDVHVGFGESSARGREASDDEASLRGQRYDFLRATAERLGMRYLATAHTADDQAETVLHHIVRGTGLAGLAGIPRVRPLSPAVTLLRPLLDTTRAEVLEYLAELGQPVREDRTNRDLRYTRNRIRHELLPLLARDYNPAAGQSLVRLAELAAAAERVVDAQAARLLEQGLLRADDARLELDCRTFARADPHVVRQALMHAWRRQSWPMQAMGSDEWRLLGEMALGTAATANKRMLPGAVCVTRCGDRLVFERG